LPYVIQHILKCLSYVIETQKNILRVYLMVFKLVGKEYAILNVEYQVTVQFVGDG
jgi:hypothetical protein